MAKEKEVELSVKNNKARARIDINLALLSVCFLILIPAVCGATNISDIKGLSYGDINNNKGLLYGSSYIIGLGEGNNPRFEIGSKITVSENNYIEIFYSGMGMLGEDTFGEKNLILYPTYYFSVIFGKSYNFFVRSYGVDVPNSKDSWVREVILSECNVTEINNLNMEYAIYKGKNIIGRTRFINGSREYLMEYPVRTINYYNGSWQVDTGKVAIPKFMDKDSLSLGTGYIVFNNYNQSTVSELLNVKWLKYFKIYDNYYSRGKLYDVENKLFYLDC